MYKNMFKHFKRLHIYIIHCIYIYIMSEDFEFFSNDLIIGLYLEREREGERERERERERESESREQYFYNTYIHV